jgi:ligand-binding sensor domain-containing protein/DNA-binding CsgD family transcriptional regulator
LPTKVKQGAFKEAFLLIFKKPLMIMSQFRLLLLLLLLPYSLVSQNTIGLPDVINYPKQAYGAGLQNWEIKQDKNGIIYIANNEGLLSFDGKNWNLYPLPNKTIVRSVEVGPDGKIYVGGQDELGYFIPGVNGRLQYQSLTRLLSARDKSFGDVWDIVFFKNDIFFRSPAKIFRFINEAVTSYPAPGEWAFLGSCNGRLYAHDYVHGLLHFDNNVWEPLFEKNTLPVNDPVTAILSIEKANSIITTLKHGLFVLSSTGIVKLESVNNALFESERIYAATRVNDEWMALASNNSGIYITDLKGNIIQSFSKTEGLQNKNVLSIFLDNQRNLWLGLDNGIDMIAYNSAIKKINPFFQDGSGYTALIYNNRLYAGTSSALFSVDLQETPDLSFSRGNFSPVNNTKGQTWGLAEINDQLLLGHHDGAFIVADNTVQSISGSQGFWNFVPMSNTFPARQIVAGNYKGLVFFDYVNGHFTQLGEVPGFIESCRFAAIDNADNIWVSHPYHGVYKISRQGEGPYTTTIYTDKKGLPSTLNNHVYKVKSEVIVATEKGVYAYNKDMDSFEPSAFYQKLLGTQGLRYIKDDAAGNIWFIHDKSLGVADLTGKEPAIIYFPELNNKLLSGFEFIYPVNDNNIFLGGEKGFFHINYEKYKKTITELTVQIRTIRIGTKSDSLLFGGYFSNVNEKQEQQSGNIPRISHNMKTIRVEFSSTVFGYQANMEYSFRLRGFDDNWSDWNKRTEKEYTNLAAGDYTFEVKVRNNLGNESAVAVYAFTILPPWYLTIWAKIFYVLLLGGVLYFLYRWQHKKLIRQQALYEDEQKRLQYIHELELNKTESELVTMRNEKLEADINFKNSELASSAMHLVKKGELLTKIKAELTQVMKGIDNPDAITELKKMTRSLSEDDNMDKEWESFAKHFDKVHSDFVLGLKEAHPNITPNEVKLSAYLRMNLSTKEIAQLMNISVRGVEISRYRLRKKLKISSETNLFDYLISIQQKLG